MTLFYPNNFPKQLETALLRVLQSVEAQYQKNADQDIAILLKKTWGNQDAQLTQGRTAPFWWYTFVLLRHKRKFTPVFFKAARTQLVKTKVRSLSGVVTLTVFTAGRGCPFNCIYCPNEPGIPKSYLSDEPAVMRAQRNSFDAYKQVQNRLMMLALSGHSIEKTELIVKGGTFSHYPREYRTQYMLDLFRAANTDIIRILTTGKQTRRTSISTSPAAEQKKNESARSRIIGINIETRPDYITASELRFLRTLGVTHIELGVQHPDNAIYTHIKRGHTVEDVFKATQRIKDAGYKLGYHIMPNLPKSSLEKDRRILNSIFRDSRFRPDHLKLYPTTITRHTQLYELYQNGDYAPYPIDVLIPLLAQWKAKTVPRWVRIGRLTRDITTTMMDVHLFPPNLRQLLHTYMEEHKLHCNCIRCREVGERVTSEEVQYKTTRYDASGGKEYFIEAIGQDDVCFGFLRLRFPSFAYNRSSQPILPVLSDSAIIRELHVYGQSLPMKTRVKGAVQHTGIGTRLLTLAEDAAYKEGFAGITVISGIGARQYYRSLGYRDEQTYMKKSLRVHA